MKRHDNHGIGRFPLAGNKARRVLAGSEDPDPRMAVAILIVGTIKVQMGEIGQSLGPQDIHDSNSLDGSKIILSFWSAGPIINLAQA
jgi:hypothetical protein